jgi:predicted transcriptional regulator
VDDLARTAARRALADYLRGLRARCSPPPDAHRRVRRVPGLSRRDVAARAGLTSRWYALAETGRASGVSAATVRAIADALELDDAERAALTDLFAAVYPRLRS